MDECPGRISHQQEKTNIAPVMLF